MGPAHAHQRQEHEREPDHDGEQPRLPERGPARAITDWLDGAKRARSRAGNLARRAELRKRYVAELLAGERALQLFQTAESRLEAKPTTDRAMTIKQQVARIQELESEAQVDMVIGEADHKVPGVEFLEKAVELGQGIREMREGDEEARQAQRRLKIVEEIVAREQAHLERVFHFKMTLLECADSRQLEVMAAEPVRPEAEAAIVERLSAQVRARLREGR
jgi:hypothetical protein